MIERTLPSKGTALEHKAPLLSGLGFRSRISKLLLTLLAATFTTNQSAVVKAKQHLLESRMPLKDMRVVHD